MTIRLSIRSKLILAIGVPLVVVYLCVLWLDYRAGKETALHNMRRRLKELAAHHAARFGGRFSTIAQVARSTATFLRTRPDLDEKQLDDLLRHVVRDNKYVYGSCIAFAPNAFHADRIRFAPYVYKGKEGLRSVDVGRESYDYFRWDWYLVPVLLGRPIWTDPFYDEGAGNILMCTYSVPFHRDAALWGVATVDISLENLRDEVSATKIGKGYCMIVGQNGVFISHPDASLIMRETVFSLAEWHDMPELAVLGRKMISGESGVERIPDYLTGEPKWAVFAPIPGCGWSFAALISEDAVMAPVYAKLRHKMELMIIGLVLIVGLILLTAIRITRPISRLALAVQAVASGDLNARAAGIRTGDEIGEFANAFNKMVADLKAHVQALTRETAARQAVESELRVARTIQTSLLPRTFPPFPHRKEFDLYAANVPAKHVAGDFYDFYFVSDDRLAITIGDVSGKGVPAALFMAVARTLLKNLAMSGLGPGEVLKRSNHLIAEDNEEGMFVTLFLGLYETQTGRLRFASAGHNPPFHVNAEGRIAPPLRATGAILGAVEGQEYGEEEVQILPGDMLVLYTDGVTEAHLPGMELFGEKRFEELLSQHATENPEQLCQTIVDGATEYQQGARYDDITLLVLRRRG